MKDSVDPSDLHAYLDSYPGGAYEALARNRLNRLQGSSEPVAPESSLSPPGQELVESG